MRVLLIGSDTALGLALTEHLQRWGRHDLELVSTATARWKSERHAKKAVRRNKPDVVVDARIQTVLDSGERLTELDVERSHWLAKSCQRNGSGYLLLSSARVFSGESDRPYREHDSPDAGTQPGLLLQRAETLVRDTCERHLVLRLGQVFSAQGSNVLTRILEKLMMGGKLALDNQRRGCPVAAADAARVVAGVLDQLGAGADGWGTFHYCSPDPTNCYEFAEVLLASASQFSEFESDAVQLQATADVGQRSRILYCGQIRNTFAIKQVPWRGFVADAVSDYFHQRQQQAGSSHG